MRGWKTWKLHDRVLFVCKEFGVPISYFGEVTEIRPDHLIAICNGMRCWVDDDTQPMFKKL